MPFHLFEYEYAYYKLQTSSNLKLKLHWRSICYMQRQRLINQLYAVIHVLHWQPEHQSQSAHISKQMQSAITKICKNSLIIS